MARWPLVCSLRSALVIAILLACQLAAPLRALADEPAPPAAKQVVEVKLWVVEVSNTKLRNLGFDWDGARADPKGIASKRIDDRQFLDFLTALEQNNLARKHASPMVMTPSGRKATIELDPHLKVEVTPTVAADEHVELAYYIDIADVRRTGGRFITAHSTELKSGVAQLLSETTTHQRTAKGEPNNSTLLVLAQATIVK